MAGRENRASSGVKLLILSDLRINEVAGEVHRFGRPALGIVLVVVLVLVLDLSAFDYDDEDDDEEEAVRVCQGFTGEGGTPFNR